MPFLKLDLDDQDIGKFIQRETDKGRVLTLPHYVESVVDSDAVTHCGRRMRRGTGYPFREVTAEGACLYCAEMAPAVTYTITSNDPLQTITGPRVEWTTPDDDPTVGQVDPT